MMYSDFDEVHTNVARPKTSAVITVRVIKSFEYRTERSLVLRDVDLETTTVGQLKGMARQAVSTQPGWKPYRNVTLDTLKLYSQAHGSKVIDQPFSISLGFAYTAKTTNLIINLDNDEWILNYEDKLLADVGFENETEVSFFNRELYEMFKANPETKWD